MTTTTSSSEKTRFFSIYRSTLKNQLAFGIIIGILTALMIPLVYFVSFPRPALLGLTGREEIAAYLGSHDFFLSGVYWDNGQSTVVMFCLIVFAVVIALVQNAYMHSKKMTDLYHSLPVKRGFLLGANFLASMTTIFVPFLTVYLFTMMAQLIQYGAYFPSMWGYFQYIALDLLCAILAAVAAYLFTTFIAVNVGTVFDAFALTLVLGFSPMVVYAISAALWSSVTYGGTGKFDFILLLSPFTFAFQRYVDLDFSLPLSLSQGMPLFVGGMALWAVLSCGIYLAAVYRYHRRKSEIAEQTQTEGVFQTIAKCVAAFCGGAMFLAIFFDRGSTVVRVVAILAGALLIGLIGELILSRGVRAVKKNLKWLLAAGGLCCLVFLGSQYDWLGYTTRVPAVSSIESATINYQGLYQNGYNYGEEARLSSPEALAIITDAHRLAVEDQPPQSGDWRNGNPWENYPSCWLTLQYRLKNGSVVDRRYHHMNIPAQTKLTELDANPEYLALQTPILFDQAFLPDIQGVSLHTPLGKGGDTHQLAAADRERLVQALGKDLLAQSYEDLISSSQAELGTLVLHINPNSHRMHSQYTSFVVKASYTGTVDVLTHMGLIGEFSADEPIDRVCFIESTHYFGESVSIKTLTPNEGSRMAESFLKDLMTEEGKELPQTKDAGEIKAVRAAGRSQIFAANRDFVIACYYSGEECLGAQLVRLDRLPQELSRRIQSADDNDASPVTMAMPAYS